MKTYREMLREEKLIVSLICLGSLYQYRCIEPLSLNVEDEPSPWLSGSGQFPIENIEQFVNLPYRTIRTAKFFVQDVPTDEEVFRANRERCELWVKRASDRGLLDNLEKAVGRVKWSRWIDSWIDPVKRKIGIYL